MRNVVVTGLGFVTCLGNNKESVSRNLQEMKHGIVRYEPFADDVIPLHLAAPVQDFDTHSNDPEDWSYPPGFKIRMDKLRGLAPHGLYATYAVRQAMADAGLDEEDISNPRSGLYSASVGSTRGLYYNLERMKRLGPQRCSPMGIVSSIAGTLNFNLVAAFKIKGASCGFVSACSSGGHALGMAWDEIALGRQDRMIVVGAEDCNKETILPFVSMRVLSLSKDPNRASRPFDQDRDGFVGTGGAAVMILEEESVARERGATPYAKVLGWGQSSDGYHVAIAHPQGEGLKRAMEQALESADLSPESVDYINAHATSTPMGDLSELRAIKTVFGDRGSRRPAVSSTKALTGHALSLSSVMEASFSALAMKEGFMPGSAHIENLDDEADGVNIIQETLQQAPQVLMSNSCGFGGLMFRFYLAKLANDMIAPITQWQSEEVELRILVLTSSTGSGHDKRAYAFRDWAEKLYAGRVEVRVEHLSENSSPLIRLGVELYNVIHRRAPRLHNLYWHVVEHFMGSQSDVVFWGGQYYRNLLQDYQPQVVLSFHDSINRGYFEDAKRVLGRDSVLCGTYCGEWSGGRGFSRNWVNPSADFYFSRTEEALDYAVGLGIPKERCKVCCNFLPPKVWQEKLQEDERAQFLSHGLRLDPEKFTVFLATGGFGANNHLKLLDALVKRSDTVQAIVVCGRNKVAYQGLLKWSEEHPEFSICLEGYSSRMHLLMQVCDAIVTRGGANTTAEALYYGCPVIFNGMGGVMPQERLTIDYFVQREAAVFMNSARDFEAILGGWLDDIDSYLLMKERFLDLRRKDDPQSFVKDLVEEVLDADEDRLLSISGV